VIVADETLLGGVVQYSAATGAVVGSARGQVRSVSRLWFMPGGQTLLTAGRSADPFELLALRPAPATAALPELPGHAACVVFSPDGSRLACAGGGMTGHDAAVYVWDLSRGGKVWEARLKGESPETLRFDSTGGRLLGLLRPPLVWGPKGAGPAGVVWDAATGREVGRFPLPKLLNRLTPGVIAPDGSAVVVPTGTGVQVVDPTTGAVRADIPLARAADIPPGRAGAGLKVVGRSAAFCPDSGHVFVVTMFDSETASLAAESKSRRTFGEYVDLGRGKVMSRVDLGAGWRSVREATGPTVLISGKGGPEVYDPAADRTLGRVEVAGFPAAATPDGRRVAVVGALGTKARAWRVVICETRTGRPLLALKYSAGHALASDIAFSPDGTRLAVAADDGVVRVWHAP
jgi:WD40 repeat protein